MTAPASSHGFAALPQRSAANREQGFRQLLWISGDYGWCQLQTAELHRALSPKSSLWLGSCSLESDGVELVRIGGGKRFLGSEQDLIVLNGHDGLDPDDLGAVAGTVMPGGFLVVLSPPADDWVLTGNPVLERLLSHGLSASQGNGFYLNRLIRTLTADVQVIRLDQRAGLCMPEPTTSAALAVREGPSGFASYDQFLAVEAIDRVLTGHRRRPLVMTADRGRGKTVALAIAASAWLQRGVEKVLITAPSRRVVEPIFDWIIRSIPIATMSGNCLHVGDSTMEFVAPDSLVRIAPKADVVLVDEAAAIPVSMLERLVTRYSRLVFSSTVHGYEGTGRGFAIRFRASLDHLAPGWHSVALTQPVRYAESDPLEQTVNDLLLLDAEPLTVRESGAGEAQFEWLDVFRLAHDEALLSQVFGLLVQAHYQTSPLDLMHLLDSPDLRIGCLKVGQAMVAVILLVEEGGLDADLMQAVFRGQRRPRGHLIPQTLAAHAGVWVPENLRGYRVMRIAVTEGFRRQGLGCQLLEHAQALGLSDGMDFIASSFGATPNLLDFWAKAGFEPIHVGSGRNNVTGEHAAIVFHGLSDAGRGLQSQASRLFHRHLFPQLAESLSDLEYELLPRLLSARQGPEMRLEATDFQVVEAFAYHQRPYLASMAALKLWLEHCLHGEFSHDSRMNVLVGKVLQGKSWPQLAVENGVSGQKDVERLMRVAVAGLLRAENANG